MIRYLPKQIGTIEEINGAVTEITHLDFSDGKITMGLLHTGSCAIEVCNLSKIGFGYYHVDQLPYVKLRITDDVASMGIDARLLTVV